MALFFYSNQLRHFVTVIENVLPCFFLLPTVSSESMEVQGTKRLLNYILWVLRLECEMFPIVSCFECLTPSQ